MNTRKNLTKAKDLADRLPTKENAKKMWGRACAGFALVALTCIAQDKGNNDGAFRPEKSFQQSPVNVLPDANAQMEIREKQGKQKFFDAANAARKKQIAEDSNNLVTLAIALKAEVERTKSSELSPNALRKADGMERLAHNVKQKMQFTVGRN
jgi:hypothetical protein